MGDILEREKTEAQVKLLFPNGFGYGDGVVSVKVQMESGELSHESLCIALEIAKSDPGLYVQVDHEADDDGCGDGRATNMIYRLLNPITGVIERYKRSLRRAKLFGGGLVTTSSMWRAVEGPDEHTTLEGDREFIADKLAQHGIKHGAHTAIGHDDDKSCGCGAIDHYEDISRNVTVFRGQINKTLRIVYGDSFDDNLHAVDSVFETYASLNDTYFANTNGAQTMKFIESRGSVIKQLEGAHKEGMVVINDVEGTTFDQAAFRQKLIKQGISTDIQAFVVDLWRGRMYAEFIADRAAELGHGREESYRRAYADFLIRTLAVSATLTAGDQPVILRSAQN